MYYIEYNEYNVFNQIRIWLNIKNFLCIFLSKDRFLYSKFSNPNFKKTIKLHGYLEKIYLCKVPNINHFLKI